MNRLKGYKDADEFFEKNNVCIDGNYMNAYTYENNPNSPSQFYPYWNYHNFNNIYYFNSSFELKILKQPCLTCFPNCELKIGLYQPGEVCGSGNIVGYPNESSGDKCQRPPSPPLFWNIYNFPGYQTTSYTYP